ncbi:MAG: hypothetical protein ACI4WW_02805 [Candidatus Coprovivens sp.]
MKKKEIIKKINEIQNEDISKEQLLIALFKDEKNNIRLDYLDFFDFDGDIYINKMLVKNNCYASNFVVNGNLIQDRQYVRGNLIQHHCVVTGDIYQDYQTSAKNIYQGYQKCNYLLSGNHINIKTQGLEKEYLIEKGQNNNENS